MESLLNGTPLNTPLQVRDSRTLQEVKLREQ